MELVSTQTTQAKVGSEGKCGLPQICVCEDSVTKIDRKLESIFYNIPKTTFKETTGKIADGILGGTLGNKGAIQLGMDIAENIPDETKEAMKEIAGGIFGGAVGTVLSNTTARTKETSKEIAGGIFGGALGKLLK